MEPPSTRPWLGVGAALSALPAAGGCFCAALVLAVVADSDPGGVYEQHRWLGAIVAASAVCAYVAMMGWATLRHGGLPAPVLLMALALSGVPFLLPGGLFLPAAALAVAGCAALATAGLRHAARSPETTRTIAAGLGAAALLLAVTQAIGVNLAGASKPARSRVLAAAPHPAKVDTTRKRSKASSRATPGGRDAVPAPPRDAAPRTSSPAKPGGKDAVPAPARDAAPRTSSPAKPGGKDAVPAPAKAAPEPVPAAEDEPAGDALEGPVVAPAEPAPAVAPDTAGARRFVEDYYAALDAHRFAAAWNMLEPEVQHAFGSFEGWRKGYSRTVAHAADGLEVSVAGTSATVGLTLRAGDRGACGRTVERRFAVTWRLARTEAGWRATAASARKLSGPEPC